MRQRSHSSLLAPTAIFRTRLKVESYRTDLDTPRVADVADVFDDAGAFALTVARITV